MTDAKYYFEAIGNNTGKVRFTSEQGDRDTILKAAQDYQAAHPKQTVTMFAV